MKKYSIILLTITSIAFSQNDSTAWYHPLHIGNEWVFKNNLSSWQYGYPTKTTISSMSRKVVGDTIVNDIRFVVIEENNHKTKQISRFIERYDILSGAYYRNPSIPNFMLDSIFVTTPNKMFNEHYMKFVNIVHDTILGIPTTTRATQSNVIGVIEQWNFSHGMGVTKEIYSDVDFFGGTGLTKTIAYAKVNGKEYGTKAILYADSLSQYHPLHTNDRWIYRNTNYHFPQPPIVSYFSKEVIGDTLLNGNIYKIIQQKDLATNSISKSFERFDDVNGNYIRFFSNTQVEDSTFSSTINSTFGNHNSRRLMKIKQDTVLGMYTTIRDINIGNIIGEYDQGWSYAYGLGLINESISELPPSPVTNLLIELVYAKINGKEYGVDPQKKMMDSLLQYYPLQTGNTWIYTIGNTNTVEIHTILNDTLMSNGKIYSVRVKENKDLINGAISKKIISYERIDTNSVQIFNGYNTYEIRTDSLLSKKGDTTKSGIKTIYIDNGSENIFGATKFFRTIKTPFPPFENIIKYSYGIGITNRIENTYYDEYPFSLANSTNYGIVFAKVNGIEYGTNLLSVEDNHTNLPTEFSLSQNYPNPFNPTTTILYQLPIDAYVSLKVYDAIGREVATVVNESEYAGRYKINFNASSLSSGLYFYRLRAGSFSQTNKMVLLR